MDSNYHIFKKAVQSKGKTVHKWYYYWNDPVTGVMRQKVCKGCKTQAEAYTFVSALPPLFVKKKSLSPQLENGCIFQEVLILNVWRNLESNTP